jgi:hypothetical protein
LDLVPVAGVREHDFGQLGDPGRAQFAASGVDHRSICPKSAEELVSSAAITIWRSVVAACAL